MGSPCELPLTYDCSMLVTDCNGDGVTRWNADSFSENVLDETEPELLKTGDCG